MHARWLDGGRNVAPSCEWSRPRPRSGPTDLPEHAIGMSDHRGYSLDHSTAGPCIHVKLVTLPNRDGMVEVSKIHDLLHSLLDRIDATCT